MNTQSCKRNLIILVITAVALLMPIMNNVKAALRNYGIPVRCSPTPSGQKIQPLSSAFFYCFAADGTAFKDNQRGPLYLILGNGDRMDANNASTGDALRIHVTGLLIKNASYLPMITN